MAFTHQLFLWPSGDPNLGCLASYRLALRSENSVSRRGMDIPNVVTTSWTWEKTHHYEKYINLSLIFTIYIYMYMLRCTGKLNVQHFITWRQKNPVGIKQLNLFYILSMFFFQFHNIWEHSWPFYGSCAPCRFSRFLFFSFLFCFYFL